MTLLDIYLANSGFIYLCVFSIFGFFLLVSRCRILVPYLAINNAGVFGLASVLLIPVFSSGFSYIYWGLSLFLEFYFLFFFLIFCSYFAKDILYKNIFLRFPTLLFLLFCKIIILLSFVFMTPGGYGLFSDGSHIDFLINSPYLARLRYVDEVISFIIIFHAISNSHKFGFIRVVFLIFTIIILSIFTGSKGAVFLTIFYAILFSIFYKRSLIKYSVILKYLISFIFILLIYFWFVSEYLDLDPFKLLSLIFSRFLLSADARILAFDPAVTSFVLNNTNGLLINEMFRGVSLAIGAEVGKYTFGVYQYMYIVSDKGFIGSTSQLSALFVIFRDSTFPYAFFLAILLPKLIFGVFFLFFKSKYKIVKWVSFTSFLMTYVSFQNGVDAFFQQFIIYILLCFLLWLFFDLTSKLRIYKRVINE